MRTADTRESLAHHVPCASSGITWLYYPRGRRRYLAGHCCSRPAQLLPVVRRNYFQSYCLTEECNPCGVVASRDILPRLPHNGRLRSARTALCQDTDAIEPQRLTQGRRSRNGVQGARPLVRRSRTGGMGRPPVPITGPLPPPAPLAAPHMPRRGEKGAFDSRHAGFL